MSAAGSCCVSQLDKSVKISLVRRLVWHVDRLGSATCVDGTSARTRPYGDIIDKVHGDVLVVLLHNKDGTGHIARLCLLVGRQIFDIDIDKEYIGKVVNLGLANVGLFVNIAMNADIPALVGPVSIRPLWPMSASVYGMTRELAEYLREVQDLGGLGGKIAVVDS